MMEFHADDLLGQVVTFDEPDYADGYAFGFGELRLRLLSVSFSRADPGWVTVVGAFMDFHGVEDGLRRVSVRAEALAAHWRRAVRAQP